MENSEKNQTEISKKSSKKRLRIKGMLCGSSNESRLKAKNNHVQNLANKCHSYIINSDLSVCK